MLILNNFGDIGLLILRLVIGIIFIYHGLPKLLNSSKMSGGMGMSATFIFILGLVEILGGLGSILGFYTQIAAIILSIVMLGAIYNKMFVWNVPFSKSGVIGWEFDLMILGGILALLFLGSGNISIDSLIGLYP